MMHFFQERFILRLQKIMTISNVDLGYLAKIEAAEELAISDSQAKYVPRLGILCPSFVLF